MPTSKNFRQMMTAARPKELFFNDMQSRVLQLMPKTLVCEWGRGTGKGVVEAGRILYAVQHMPGSCLGMVAPSVKRCQTNILPSALVHLEEWGYKRDVHYIVGKKPWKALHWQDPHFQPMNWENTVAFYNGSYLNIISQDRSGTSNSLSLDHVFIDEAKFIDWEQLNNETLPANRGNKQLFGDCCLHHGLTITSDTSATKKGSWFMSWEKKQDKELVATMETVIVHLHSIRNKLAAHPERYDYYMKEVQKYEKILKSLRSYALVYSRCSSIQNLAVLGEDFIKQMKRDLPKMTFQTSIMCMHVGIAQDGFYSGLDEDRNFYTAPNTSFLDNLQYKFDKRKDKVDCRTDGDIEDGLPLIIGCDANANINCLVTGQVGSDQKLRVLKSFYVKYERKLPELTQDFCDYYKYLKSKRVIFYYDATFVGNSYATHTEDFYQIISRILRKNGWLVTEIYIGKPWNHLMKQELINRMFKGKANHMILINEDNNDDLIISIESAGCYNNGKDKRGEKLVETDEDRLENRTDFSDAFDTVCIGAEKFPQAVLYTGGMGCHFSR